MTAVARKMKTYVEMSCSWDGELFYPGYNALRRAKKGLPIFCGHACSNRWKAENGVGHPYSRRSIRRRRNTLLKLAVKNRN